MKKNLLFIASILLSWSVVAQEVKIIGSDIVENSGTVRVSFTAEVAKLRSNERLTITPVVYNGAQSQSLRPIVITGRNRSITDRRAKESHTEALRTGENMQIPYTITFSYQSWMGDLSLRIDRKVVSCCDERVPASLAVVEDKPIRYDVVIEPIKPIANDLSLVQNLDLETTCLSPIAEYTALNGDLNALRTEGALLIKFKQGSDVIDPALDQNQKALAKIKEIVQAIESDPQARLEKIVLAGASSPEGTAQKNNILSQKRAEALKQYLGTNVSTKANLFEVVNVGEDWMGLRQQVEASEMKYKNEVLTIMDKYSVRQGREKYLMDLKWGRPYNYMLEHFFPTLRSAGYIRLFYQSNPSPEVETINKAIELYNRAAYADVLTCLGGVTPTAVTEYMRGGCQMMLGDYAASETTLQNAITLGSLDASKQLEQLHKLQRIKK
ncbi:MAG: OmpA family protein [Rikenellaceae bacterium]